MFASLFTVVCALEVQLQKHEKEWPIIALKGSGGEKSGPWVGIETWTWRWTGGCRRITYRKAPIAVLKSLPVSKPSNDIIPRSLRQPAMLWDSVYIALSFDSIRLVFANFFCSAMEKKQPKRFGTDRNCFSFFVRFIELIISVCVPQ